MKKRAIILLTMTTLLAFTAVFGDTAVSPNTAPTPPKSEVKKLTAQIVISDLEKNSIELQLAGIKTDIARKAAKDAQNRYDDRENDNSLRVASLKADSEVINAQQGKKDLLCNLKIKVGRLFTSGYEANEQITILENDIKNAEKDLEEAKVKYKNGSISEEIYSSSEKKLLELKKNLTNMRTSYNNTLVDIKKLAGLPIDTPVEIEQYRRTYSAYNPISINEIIKIAAEDSYAVAKSKKDLIIAEQAYDAVRGTDANGTAAYSTLVEKRANIKDALAQEELDLWTQYNTLKISDDQVKIADIDLKVAELNHAAAQIKYKSAQITEYEKSTADLTYQKAQSTRISAVNEYMYQLDLFLNMLEPVK